jgi:hypothetical protein
MKPARIAAFALCLAASPLALAGECGIVELYDKTNNRQDIYPVSLYEINGETQFRRAYLRKLPPGKYTLLLGEQIPPSELSHQVARHPDRTIRRRELTIDVQPGVLYVIGAKFIVDQKSDPKAYWAPIVLRDEGHPCSTE